MPWVGWKVPNPVPVTVAMLTPADPRAGYTRYGTPADWSMGVPGNDVDIAVISTPVQDDTGTVTPYPIRTQTAKAAAMNPPLVVLADLGKDYGPYSGQTGRTGTIGPHDPYPTTP